jgi:hypothetical protein
MRILKSTIGNSTPQVRAVLKLFLARLQNQGPYSPAIQNACEMEEGERYSYEYAPLHTVFWRVLESQQANFVTPSDQDEIFVFIQALGRLKNDIR